MTDKEAIDEQVLGYIQGRIHTYNRHQIEKELLIKNNGDASTWSELHKKEMMDTSIFIDRLLHLIKDIGVNSSSN